MAQYRILENANAEIDRLRDQSCAAFDEWWEADQVVKAARSVVRESKIDLNAATVTAPPAVMMQLCAALDAYDKYRKERR